MLTKVKYQIGSDEPAVSFNAFGDPAGAGAPGVVSMPFVIDLRRSELPATDLLAGNTASAPGVVAPMANNVSHDAGAVEPVRVSSIPVDGMPKETPASDPGFDPMPGGAMPAPGTVPEGWVETPNGRWVHVEGSADETQSPVPLDVGVGVADVPQVGLPLVAMVDGLWGTWDWVPFDVLPDTRGGTPYLPVIVVDPVVPTPLPDPTDGTLVVPIVDRILVGRDEHDDVLGGERGNNMIIGKGGNDDLWGGLGNDTLAGGSGNDGLTGGGGADVFMFEFGESGVDGVVDFRVGEDKILLAGLGYSSFADITLVSRPSSGWWDPAATEIIIDADTKIMLFGVNLASLSAADFIFTDVTGSTTGLSSTALVLTGSDASETIIGGLGNDTLSGKGGNDIINGQDGNDTLAGGSGDDWILGGDGDDWLSGGDGNDSLVGDAGADVFSFGFGEAGVDRIEFFNVGEDKILLAGLGYSRFEDLTLVSQPIVASWLGGNIPATEIIVNADTKIVLVGVDLASLSAADFLYT